MSRWENVPMAPADPILGLNVAFNKDTSPNKVNLGVGAYRTEEGKPLVLKVVRQVEKELAADASLNKEYIPIEGIAAFNTLTSRLLLGDNHPCIVNKQVATVQSLSGTGALRIGFEFLRRYSPNSTVYISDPTWSNHMNIVRDAGLKFAFYRYWDANTRGLDYKGMTEDIKNAADGSVILLHLCAHNPTGVDPTEDQWKAICDLCIQKKHIVFFDSAYQGFASGDLIRDSWAARYFAEKGLEILVSQSYAKNFGLYGERIGAINFVCSSAQTAECVLSQAKAVVRAMYSSPQIHGAQIVARVLGDKNLFAQWDEELKEMSGRIIAMRQLLRDALIKRGTPGTWDHITSQIGMFSYTGLSKIQCETLISKYHIYLTSNGRISMAGINKHNIDYIANAIDDVVRNVQ